MAVALLELQTQHGKLWIVRILLHLEKPATLIHFQLFQYSISGSYKKSGDSIIFTDNDGKEERGSLIGENLTAFGRRFQRLK